MPDAMSDLPAGAILAEAVPETYEDAIARLAKLPLLEYERVRVAEAERLRSRAPILDSAVRAARGENNPAHGREVALHDAALWPEPVEIGAILDALVSAIRRHVIVSTSQAASLALWICHTWVFERFDHTPRLAITSPTKQCGKSTLLDVLRIACRRTLKADNVSAAGIFRTVEALHPLTLLIDEADSFLKDREELRGVLNSGYERSGQVIRVEERRGEQRPVMFATFCPVALAAIGDLPATLSDRAVPIVLARKAASETTTKLRARGARDALAMIARKLARWAADNASDLSPEPAIPDELGDREGDISVPLLAIADQAGQAWGKRGRRALLDVFKIRAADDGAAEAGTMMLSDLRGIFREKGNAERLPSAEIAAALGELETRPWPEWKNAKPITTRQLAVVLRPFGIHPQNIKLSDGKVVKGYVAANMADAFKRYLPEAAEPGVPNRYHRYRAENTNINGESDPLPTVSGSGSEILDSINENKVVAAVADRHADNAAGGVPGGRWEAEL